MKRKRNFGSDEHAPPSKRRKSSNGVEKEARKKKLAAEIKRSGLEKAFPVDSNNIDRSLEKIYARLRHCCKKGLPSLGLTAEYFSKGGPYTAFSWPTAKGIEKFAEIYFNFQSLKEEKTKLKPLLIAAIKAEGLEKAFPVDSNNIDRSLKKIYNRLQHYGRNGVSSLKLTAEQFNFGKEGSYIIFGWPTEKGVEKVTEIYLKLQSHKEGKTKKKMMLKERLIAVVKKAGLEKAFPVDSTNIDRSLGSIYGCLQDYSGRGVAFLGLTAEDFSKGGPYTAFSWPTAKGIEKFAEIYFKYQSLKEEQTKKRAELKPLLITAIKAEGLEKAFPVDSNNIDRSLKKIYNRLQQCRRNGVVALGLTAKDFSEGGPHTVFGWPTVAGIKKRAEVYFKLQRLKASKAQAAPKQPLLIAAIKKMGLEKAFPVDPTNINRSLKRIYSCLQRYSRKGVASLKLTAEAFSKEGPYVHFPWPTVGGVEKYAEIYFKLQPFKAKKIGERIAVEKEVQKPSRSNRVQAPPPLSAKEDDRSIEEGLSPSSNAVLYESGIGLFAPLEFERPLEPEGDIETFWEEGVLGAF